MPLLQGLLKSARENADRKRGGLRYNNELKLFFSYLYTVGGRTCYEIFQRNFGEGIVPSISSACRTLASNSSHVKEGQFRFKELRKYLISKSLPLVVWISEDATRITGRIQYDPRTNQIVGFVLPLDKNGLPVIDSYPADSAERITSYFDQKTCSSNVYTIMAQPVFDKAAPFCVCIFGTDQVFNYSDVMKRWKWMIDEARREGIEILGFSSDGDPKLLKAMRSFTFSAEDDCIPTSCADWFSGVWNLESERPQCLQDFVHIGTKLRSCFLRQNVLPMGRKFCVSLTDIETLISIEPKEKHGLTLSDISPEDKMNFQAVLNLCDPRVTTLLLHRVPDSYATAAFLDIVHDVINSFMNPSLSPLNRVYMLWKATFFFRIWKKWLELEDYRTDENFITSNAYMCIEINAHVMIYIIRKLRSMNKAELFLPWLFSSQACEAFFRRARSMTSTLSTVVNFSMLDFIHKVNRIDFQAEIETKLSREGFLFPRERRKRDLGYQTEERLTDSSMPSDQEIINTVSTAFSDAKELAAFLEMDVSGHLLKPHLSTTTVGNDIGLDDPFNDTVDDPIDVLTDVRDDLSALDDNCGIVSDCVEVTPNSPFIVLESSGKRSKLKKSTLCWLLSHEGKKLSSDRLYRVKSTLNSKLCKKNTHSQDKDNVSIEANITRGSWNVFQNVHPSEAVLIGRIIQFSYLTGKPSERKYTLVSAPVTPPSENARGLGVLCVWYRFNAEGVLKIVEQNHTFINIENYLCSIPTPNINDRGCYQIDTEIIKDIQDVLLNL